MRVIYFLFFFASLYGSENLIDLYQKNGSASFEKIFDEKLASKAYWEKRLPDTNNSFGYFESIEYILACDKNTSSLKFYSQDENNSFKLNEVFSAFIGKKKGDKQKEGDLKTPIGVYRLLQKLDNVDPFYGPLAFVTSYPNPYDKVQGKKGSGIWLHGFPLKQKRDDFTKGCIAINNTSLEDLEKSMNYNKTLVYINKGELSPMPKNKLTTILSSLYRWKKAWKENNINDYLAFYDASFKRLDGLDLKRFSRYKTRIFNKSEYKQIHFKNINIISYPLVKKEDVFLISFDEEYRSASFQFDGEKELYVHLQNGSFKILAER